VKLIHAADIHLDSPMRGLARYDGAPVEQLRLSTRTALANLVDLAIGEDADALLIAGDLFDGDWLDYGTGAHFAREMNRLRDAAIPVIAVAGNHDAASRITKALRMPANFRMLSTKEPESAVYEDLGLAVHGQGFATPAVHDDLSAGYPAPLAGYVNVGLLHTSADGRPGHEPYAPCRPERLAQRGYEYWALGHIHQREVLVADPPIVFAGCLQGRHFREAGPKGATVVHLDEGGAVQLDERTLDEVRWAVCEVDAAGAVDENEVYARMSDQLRRIATECGDRMLAVRVKVAGATEAHTTLVRDPDRLHHEAAVVTSDAACGGAWVERAVIRTSPPSAISPDGDDAYAELVRGIRAAAGRDALLNDLAAELQPLGAKLPGALLADFDPTDADTIRDLLSEVERSLPARLLEEPA
jgi:DNA repair exonuclease SbcCD nuclease subunit